MFKLLNLKFILTLAWAFPALAFAWGSEGHQVIASLAEKQLSEPARTAIAKLLALEPGATLISISTWADEHRNPATGPWHYVNFPRETCTYDAARDCPDGKCVVAIIDRQMKVLASDAPDQERLTALKYLVHFVGDVHQPLHAGYGDDRGGNTFQLQAFMKGTNLHAVWDTGMIRSLNEDADHMAARLFKPSSKSDNLSPANAAEESCRIVGQPGFYPDRHLDADYMATFTPVLEGRLTQAGRRLALMLNAAFAGAAR